MGQESLERVRHVYHANGIDEMDVRFTCRGAKELQRRVHDSLALSAKRYVELKVVISPPGRATIYAALDTPRPTKSPNDNISRRQEGCHVTLDYTIPCYRSARDKSRDVHSPYVGDTIG